MTLTAADCAGVSASILRNHGLLGRCSYYRGRAERALGQWGFAYVSFKNAQKAKGRYIEGEQVEKLMDEMRLHADSRREWQDDGPSQHNGTPTGGATTWGNEAFRPTSLVKSVQNVSNNLSKTGADLIRASVGLA